MKVADKGMIKEKLSAAITLVILREPTRRADRAIVNSPLDKVHRSLLSPCALQCGIGQSAQERPGGLVETARLTSRSLGVVIGHWRISSGENFIESDCWAS